MKKNYLKITSYIAAVVLGIGSAGSLLKTYSINQAPINPNTTLAPFQENTLTFLRATVFFSRFLTSFEQAVKKDPSLTGARKINTVFVSRQLDTEMLLIMAAMFFASNEDTESFQGYWKKGVHKDILEYLLHRCNEVKFEEFARRILPDQVVNEKKRNTGKIMVKNVFFRGAEEQRRSVWVLDILDYIYRSVRVGDPLLDDEQRYEDAVRYVYTVIVERPMAELTRKPDRYDRGPSGWRPHGITWSRQGVYIEPKSQADLVSRAFKAFWYSVAVSLGVRNPRQYISRIDKRIPGKAAQPETGKPQAVFPRIQQPIPLVLSTYNGREIDLMGLTVDMVSEAVAEIQAHRGHPQVRTFIEAATDFLENIDSIDSYEAFRRSVNDLKSSILNIPEDKRPDNKEALLGVILHLQEMLDSQESYRNALLYLIGERVRVLEGHLNALDDLKQENKKRSLGRAIRSLLSRIAHILRFFELTPSEETPQWRQTLTQLMEDLRTLTEGHDYLQRLSALPSLSGSLFSQEELTALVDAEYNQMETRWRKGVEVLQDADGLAVSNEDADAEQSLHDTADSREDMEKRRYLFEIARLRLDRRSDTATYVAQLLIPQNAFDLYEQKEARRLVKSELHMLNRLITCLKLLETEGVPALLAHVYSEEQVNQRISGYTASRKRFLKLLASAGITAQDHERLMPFEEALMTAADTRKEHYAIVIPRDQFHIMYGFVSGFPQTEIAWDMGKSFDIQVTEALKGLQRHVEDACQAPVKSDEEERSKTFGSCISNARTAGIKIGRLLRVCSLLMPEHLDTYIDLSAQQVTVERFSLDKDAPEAMSFDDIMIMIDDVREQMRTVMPLYQGFEEQIRWVERLLRGVGLGNDPAFERIVKGPGIEAFLDGVEFFPQRFTDETRDRSFENKLALLLEMRGIRQSEAFDIVRKIGDERKIKILFLQLKRLHNSQAAFYGTLGKNGRAYIQGVDSADPAQMVETYLQNRAREVTHYFKQISAQWIHDITPETGKVIFPQSVKPVAEDAEHAVVIAVRAGQGSLVDRSGAPLIVDFTGVKRKSAYLQKRTRILPVPQMRIIRPDSTLSMPPSVRPPKDGYYTQESVRAVVDKYRDLLSPLVSIRLTKQKQPVVGQPRFSLSVTVRKKLVSLEEDAVLKIAEKHGTEKSEYKLKAHVLYRALAEIKDPVEREKLRRLFNAFVYELVQTVRPEEYDLSSRVPEAFRLPQPVEAQQLGFDFDTPNKVTIQLLEAA